MESNARKLYIIEEVLKINSESTLAALEDFLKEVKWMTMTNPDNLNDPGQQYYTTEVGKKALAANEPAATRPEKLP